MSVLRAVHAPTPSRPQRVGGSGWHTPLHTQATLRFVRTHIVLAGRDPRSPCGEAGPPRGRKAKSQPFAIPFHIGYRGPRTPWVRWGVRVRPPAQRCSDTPFERSPTPVGLEKRCRERSDRLHSIIRTAAPNPVFQGTGSGREHPTPKKHTGCGSLRHGACLRSRRRPRVRGRLPATHTQRGHRRGAIVEPQRISKPASITQPPPVEAGGTRSCRKWTKHASTRVASRRPRAARRRARPEGRTATPLRGHFGGDAYVVRRSSSRVVTPGPHCLVLLHVSLHTQNKGHARRPGHGFRLRCVQPVSITWWLHNTSLSAHRRNQGCGTRVPLVLPRAAIVMPTRTNHARIIIGPILSLVRLIIGPRSRRHNHNGGSTAVGGRADIEGARGTLGASSASI